MAFWLSSKMVALHLDDSTAKAYLCNQGGTASTFFPDKPATFWIWPTCLVLIFFQHTYLPTSIWKISQVSLVPEWHHLPHTAEAAFQLWGQLGVDLLASSHTNQCQHYYTLENPLSLGVLGLSTFNHPGTFRWVICFILMHKFPSSVQVSGRICHRSIQNSYSNGTLLHLGYLASYCSQYVGTHSLLLSYCTNTYHGCFSGWGVQRSTTTAFNCGCSDVCSLPQSVRQWQEQLKHLWQKLPAMLGGMDQLVSTRGCTKWCLFCSLIS